MISTTQAAVILDCSPVTVWRMARARKLPFVKVGNRYRFDELTLRMFATTGTVARRA